MGIETKKAKADTRAELKRRGSIHAVRASTFVLWKAGNILVGFLLDDFGSEEKVLAELRRLTGRMRRVKNGSQAADSN